MNHTAGPRNHKCLPLKTSYIVFQRNSYLGFRYIALRTLALKASYILSQFRATCKHLEIHTCIHVYMFALYRYVALRHFILLQPESSHFDFGLIVYIWPVRYPQLALNKVFGKAFGQRWESTGVAFISYIPLHTHRSFYRYILYSYYQIEIQWIFYTLCLHSWRWWQW